MSGKESTQAGDAASCAYLAAIIDSKPEPAPKSIASRSWQPDLRLRATARLQSEQREKSQSGQQQVIIILPLLIMPFEIRSSPYGSIISFVPLRIQHHVKVPPWHKCMARPALRHGMAAEKKLACILAHAQVHHDSFRHISTVKVLHSLSPRVADRHGCTGVATVATATAAGNLSIVAVTATTDWAVIAGNAGAAV